MNIDSKNLTPSHIKVGTFIVYNELVICRVRTPGLFPWVTIWKTERESVCVCVSVCLCVCVCITIKYKSLKLRILSRLILPCTVMWKIVLNEYVRKSKIKKSGAHIMFLTQRMPVWAVAPC